jgi:hypothetical protein
MVASFPPLWSRKSPRRFLRRDGCEVSFTREGIFKTYWTAMIPSSSEYTAWQCVLGADNKATKFSSSTTAIDTVECYLDTLLNFSGK